MPIVLVQDLSPEHESMIPSLIQGMSPRKAVQATEGMRISPGTIQLTRANSDLINFLGNVDVAIVIISNDLEVRRFTPERALNLIPGDVGRSIRQVKPNINCPDLADMIRHATDTVSTREKEVSDQEGHRYLLRVRPYKDVDNRIDGAVLVVFDIETARVQAVQGELVRVEVLQALPQALVLLDSLFRVKFANQAFWALTKTTAERGLGQTFYDVPDGDWDFTALRPLLESLSRGETSARDLRIEAESDGRGSQPYRVHARRIDTSEKLFLLTIDTPEGKPKGRAAEG